MVNSFEFGGSFPSSIDFVFLHWFLQRRKKNKKKEMNELGLLGLELRITLFTKEKIDKNWPTLTWEKAKASAESCVTCRCCELRRHEHHVPFEPPEQLVLPLQHMNLVCLISRNTFLSLSASIVELMKKRKLFSKQHHNIYIYIYIYIPRGMLLTFTHKISMLIALSARISLYMVLMTKSYFLIAFNCKYETFERNKQQNLFIIFFWWGGVVVVLLGWCEYDFDVIVRVEYDNIYNVCVVKLGWCL